MVRLTSAAVVPPLATAPVRAYIGQLTPICDDVHKCTCSPFEILTPRETAVTCKACSPNESVTAATILHCGACPAPTTDNGNECIYCREDLATPDQQCGKGSAYFSASGTEVKLIGGGMSAGMASGLLCAIAAILGVVLYIAAKYAVRGGKDGAWKRVNGSKSH